MQVYESNIYYAVGINVPSKPLDTYWADVHKLKILDTFTFNSDMVMVLKQSDHHSYNNSSWGEHECVHCKSAYPTTVGRFRRRKHKRQPHGGAQEHIMGSSQ